MVKTFLLWMLFTGTLFAQDVTVTAEINPGGVAGQLLQGAITVTHDENVPVKADSFKLEGNALGVEFIRSVRMAPDQPLVVSIYHFQIQGGKKGIHVLPEVRVMVGKREYRSIPSTYELREEKMIQVGTAEQILISLEPLVEGKLPIFPGQRIKVGYRYRFNYSFELTKENVPLLEAKGFRLIGDKQFAQSLSGRVTTLDVTQLIEAVAPGEYTYGPSEIAGRAYILTPSGQKQYSKGEQNAVAAPVTLTVLPVPQKGKPPSFNGAVGKYTFDLKLQSSPEVAVGDKLTVAITIEGKGELENLPMPEICCQPGFVNQFKTSNLPPVGTISGDSKTFIVDIRPMNELIKEIPPLEFSFFNPNTKTYETLKSASIPITVSALPRVKQEQATQQPIQIGENEPISPSDLQSKWFSSWWVLWIIPLGIGVIILQKRIKAEYDKQNNQPRPISSADLYREAFQKEKNRDLFYSMLHDAIVLRLHERGAIGDALEKEARDFLERLEEVRFGGKGNDGLAEEVKTLFEKLR